MGQSGALAEHFAGVFGVLARQHTLGVTDWMVGAGIRSLDAPAHMRDYAPRGGLANCGIADHAFYRMATELGGNAWDVAGRIWYRALTRELPPHARFEQCAEATWRAAGELYGLGSAPQDAVAAAWQSVGIEVRAERGRETLRFLPPVAGAELPYLA